MHAPSDEELLVTLRDLRKENPSLGRTKVLDLLKTSWDWTLSEKQLKKCMDDNDLNALSSQKPRDAQFQGILKEAYDDFVDRERHFLLNLSPTQLHQLDEGRISDPLYPACHLRHHVEILLTLKAIKPCTLISHYNAQKIFTQMTQECLKPVIKKYNLVDYGFHLQQITHPMPTTVHRGFKDGWIFADRRSQSWPDVKQLFLIPQSRKADEGKIGKALGYPLLMGTGQRTVTYTDATEREILGTLTGKQIRSVPGFECSCEAGTKTEWEIVDAHFLRCVGAARDVGVLLRIDLGEFPEMDEYLEGL